MFKLSGLKPKICGLHLNPRRVLHHIGFLQAVLAEGRTFQVIKGQLRDNCWRMTHDASKSHQGAGIDRPDIKRPSWLSGYSHNSVLLSMSSCCKFVSLFISKSKDMYVSAKQLLFFHMDALEFKGKWFLLLGLILEMMHKYSS